MVVKCLPVGAMSVNCYIYYDENTRDAVIIDPGAESKKIIRFIEDYNLNVKAILLTHAHFDHIGAIEVIKNELDVPVCLYESENEILKSAYLNLSQMFTRKELSFEGDILFSENEVFELNEQFKLKVMNIPGHTPGGCVYYCEADQVLFSGDTLFRGTIGRTDFDYSDSQGLIDSIKNKLLTLPDETKVFPGHGGQTEILYEKQYNKFL